MWHAVANFHFWFPVGIGNSKFLALSVSFYFWSYPTFLRSLMKGKGYIFHLLWNSFIYEVKLFREKEESKFRYVKIWFNFCENRFFILISILTSDSNGKLNKVVIQFPYIILTFQTCPRKFNRNFKTPSRYLVCLLSCYELHSFMSTFIIIYLRMRIEVNKNNR